MDCFCNRQAMLMIQNTVEVLLKQEWLMYFYPPSTFKLRFYPGSLPQPVKTIGLLCNTMGVMLVINTSMEKVLG